MQGDKIIRLGESSPAQESVYPSGLARVRRSDALRHRAALIEAATAVFLRKGIEAPLDLVIEAAGVGRATLYRNFPDRLALVQALVDAQLDAIEAIAGEELGPRVLFKVLESIAAHGAVGAVLADAWRLEGAEPYLAAARTRFERILRRPLKAAKAAGFIRAEVKVGDIVLMVRMIGGAGRFGTRDDDASRKRALALLLRGLALR